MMRKRVFKRVPLYLTFSSAFLILGTTFAAGQTAATGAINGTVTDASGGLVAGAVVTATFRNTGETRQASTDSQGFYRFTLLSPGSYQLSAEKQGFKKAVQTGVSVVVTETTTVNFRLEVGSIAQEVEVIAQTNMVQTETNALGRVVDQTGVTNLPLATRNYTQILALSPGITIPVNNATDLGRGSGGLSGSNGNGTQLDSGVHVHGALGNDNNFQMNGLAIDDLFGRGAASGGIAIVSPDAIEEFKVQTGGYDADYGRNAGANVNLITRTGTNDFHGGLFEFFRDRSLNANDFFSNLTGQPKGDLHQNQFGGTLGGPILKDKLLFFGSYQGTRHKNGIAVSGRNNCRSTAVLPPLTSDRSAHAIATLFAGKRGRLQNAFGGVGPAIDPDAPNGNGTPYPYNINPVSLALLQLKLADGSYYVPNPQTASGLSTFTDACSFSENQYLADIDYLQSDRSKFSASYFISDSNQIVTFPNNAIIADAGLPGSPTKQPERFQVFSISHMYTFSSALLNELRVGFHRTAFDNNQQNPFSFSSIGAAFALKAICVFPENPTAGKDSHQGAVLLFSAVTGELLAVVNASAVTAIRTAAVTGLATRILAREDARDLAIIGAGVQARGHLEAMAAVRPLRHVRIADARHASAQRFAAEMSDRYSFPIQAVESMRAAVQNADIIVTVTNTESPVLHGEWVSEGTHVNLVGACTPNAREADSALVAAARLYVDRRESTLNESGDYLLALKEGAIGPDHISGELGDLLTGTVSGRTTAREITIFKSLGIAVEDLAAVAYLYREAQHTQAGSWVDF